MVERVVRDGENSFGVLIFICVGLTVHRSSHSRTFRK